MADGRQRIKDIIHSGVITSRLFEVKADAELWQAEMQIELTDKALDSIEEIVKEVLGEEARFRKSDDDLDRGVEIGYNTLLAEQLGRWESK